jgi:hypothetical protein
MVEGGWKDGYVTCTILSLLIITITENIIKSRIKNAT